MKKNLLIFPTISVSTLLFQEKCPPMFRRALNQYCLDLKLFRNSYLKFRRPFGIYADELAFLAFVFKFHKAFNQ